MLTRISEMKVSRDNIKEGVNELELPCLAGESVNWQNQSPGALTLYLLKLSALALLRHSTLALHTSKQN